MRIKTIVLITVIGLTLASNSCLVWADNYWNYHGSGRDIPYSEQVDDYYSLGYVPHDHPVPGAIVFGASSSSALPPAPPPTGQVPGNPNEFTVTFPDGRGGLTAVVIKRSGEGFVGPKGEYYPEFPKPWQLQMKYSGGPEAS